MTAETNTRATPDERPDLVARMREINYTQGSIDSTFEHWSVVDIENALALQEKLLLGSIRGRPAMWSDDVSFADLWRNAPEEVGDWQVVVEREPFAFAQYQLHESFGIRLVEDRGRVLGCGVFSHFNAYVAGRGLGIRVLSGWRVRTDARGMGITRMFNHISDAPSTPFFRGQFYYVRWGNLAAEQWMDAYSPGVLERTKKAEDRPPGEVAEVQQYPARPFTGSDAGIRPGRVEDFRACVRLINRTHKGLDLFRPYTEEFLFDKLHEWTWSVDKPDWFTHVYWLPNFYVLEENDNIVACAGLWDRGEHVREVWKHKEREETKTIATTCVLDFGFMRGREDAMSRLTEYLIGRTDELKRDFLVAPLQYLPRVAQRLAHLEPVPERRGITWLMQKPEGGWMYPVDPPLGRAYVDLIYW